MQCGVHWGKETEIHLYIVQRRIPTPPPLVRIVNLREINNIIQPQGFVPVPLPPSSQREILCGGLPCRAPYSALVFPPTRAEVIFGVLRKLHEFHGEFPHSFVEVFADFAEFYECCATRKEEPEQRNESAECGNCILQPPVHVQRLTVRIFSWEDIPERHPHQQGGNKESYTCER